MLAGISHHLPAILDAPSTLQSIRRLRLTDARRYEHEYEHEYEYEYEYEYRDAEERFGNKFVVRILLPII
ncbi:hypothetical protein RMSM_06766 [Rhodopirellula maiorica SM1]|uniref:Uncharacterized protein n=1 Tax=Rhodopirellula maiorica SM1 TaxID=1265738 RepID=M5RLR6_9BACT|nr:hypothetical protein [Rhodopirellula maiorica]EMI16307.1 hypothetical protein RMSM_06766 [Rhodopirellula maiorica SM1]